MCTPKSVYESSWQPYLQKAKYGASTNVHSLTNGQTNVNPYKKKVFSKQDCRRETRYRGQVAFAHTTLQILFTETTENGQSRGAHRDGKPMLGCLWQNEWKSGGSVLKEGRFVDSDGCLIVNTLTFIFQRVCKVFSFQNWLPRVFRPITYLLMILS